VLLLNPDTQLPSTMKTSDQSTKKMETEITYFV